MERQKRPEPLREERRRGKREAKKPIAVIGTEESGTEGSEETEGSEITRTGTTKTTRITRITRNTKSTRIEIARKTETTGRGRAAAAASEDAEEHPHGLRLCPDVPSIWSQNGVAGLRCRVESSPYCAAARC